MICKENKKPEPNELGICSLCSPHRSCRQCNDCGRYRPRQVLESYWIGKPGEKTGYRCIQCSCKRDPEFGKLKVNALGHIQK